MYNKLDFCFFEILFATYGLIILAFGAECNRKFLAYGNSQMNIFISAVFFIIALLFYIVNYCPTFVAGPLDELFTSCLGDNFFYYTILLGLFVALVAFQTYAQNFKVGSFEYLVLLIFGSLGLIVLERSNDLLLLYLGLELASFCFYILATYKRDSSYSTEAGLKYFLLGALASGFFLFSVVLFYGIGATTNYQLIETLVLGMDLSSSEIKIQQIALVFLISALLFKLASFPFQAWALDVYEGAPVSSVVFLSTVPKLGFLIVLVNLLFSIGVPHFNLWQLLLLSSGTLSIFWSAFAGIRQKRLKRFFAISGVANVGFLLLSLSSGSFQGVNSMIFYVLAYILTSFISWLFLVHKNQEKYKKVSLNLLDMGSIAAQNPLIGAILALVILSFAGTPPLLGFVSKYTVLVAMLDSSMHILAILVIFFSLFSGFYYLRLVKIIYFENLTDQIQGIQFSSRVSFLLSYLSLTFIYFSCYPSALITISAFFGLGILV